MKIAPGSKPGELDVTVNTPFDASPDEETVQYRVLFVQRDPRGRQFRGADDHLVTRLTPEVYRKLAQDGVVYRREIAREPKASELRVVM